MGLVVRFRRGSSCVRCENKTQAGEIYLPGILVNRLLLFFSLLPSQKIFCQRPSLFGESGIVAVAIGHREAVAGAMEKVPVQGLAVSLKARHQSLLHREAGDVVFCAEKDLRRTLEVFDRIVGMARS